MTELLKEIGDVLRQDPSGVDAVRRVLRNTKSMHREANTRDLNAVHHVPGHKFVKRNNVLFLDKDASGAGIQNKVKPLLSNFRKPITADDDDDDDEEN